MKIIIISGKRASGKTSIANAIAATVLRDSAASIGCFNTNCQTTTAAQVKRLLCSRRIVVLDEFVCSNKEIVDCLCEQYDKMDIFFQLVVICTLEESFPEELIKRAYIVRTDPLDK